MCVRRLLHLETPSAMMAAVGGRGYPILQFELWQQPRVVLQLVKAQAGRLNAFHNGNPTGDLQVAADRTRPDPQRGALVPSILPVASGCRRAFEGTGLGGRPHHRLALGAALWSRTGEAAAAAPQVDQQILARGRDLRSSEGPLVL